MNNQSNQPVSNQYEERQLESDISEEAMKERRYLWMARAFALVSVVSFLANVLLLAAIFALVPLVRVQPFYLSTQDKDQQIITVVRPQFIDLKDENLGQSFIRQYLLARFTIGTNIPSLENTWGLDGIVAWESAPTVFSEFQRTSGAFIERAKKDGFTRSVRILTVVPLGVEQDGSVWQAEVEFGDMTRDMSEPEFSKWRITMKIAFLPTREGLRWEQRLKNPMGFTVQRFGMEKLPN